MSQYSAHFDENQTPTIMGVEGTLGTADTGGTAKPLPFAVNPATGAMYVQDLAGASGTTNVLVVGGTLNAGTVVVGSISNIGQIHNAGTLAAGDNNVGNVDIVTIPQVSIGTLPTLNLTTGTITTGSLSNLAMLHAGTLTTLPQISVGTLPTLNLTTGTITTGSLTNIAQVHNAGTLAAGANNIGDIDVATGTVTLVSTVTTLSNLTNGSVRMTVGTLTTGSLSNVAMLNAGTITSVGSVLGIGGTVTVTGGGGGVEYEEGTSVGTFTLKAIGYEDAGGTLRLP